MAEITRSLLQVMAVSMAVAFGVGFLAALMGAFSGHMLGAFLEDRISTPSCRKCAFHDNCHTGSFSESTVCSGFRWKKGK